MKKLVVVMAVVAACGDDKATNPDASTPDAADQALVCDVAIIGGGAGGLHTAFRLAPTLKEKVCLFEKESELGGRLHDVPKTPGDPNSPVFGTGGMRVMEGQAVLFNLATELGITLQTPTLEGDFVNARAGWAFSKESLLPRYNVTADPGGDTETALYYKLGLQAARPTIATYPDFRSYIVSQVGGDGLAFLHDMSRFRADFEYPLDARGYMDYLDEEWDVCCTPSYPVGGMSQFIKGMAKKTTDNGGQIFLSEPVSKIERVAAGGYKLTTSKRTVNAAKIVIAIPPHALEWVGGDVAEAIKSQRQFKEIIGVKVVTIAQWWPNRWWANLKNPALTAPEDNLWRAWSTEHCFNLIEMPLQQYAVDQAVTRSVYDDDRNCVDFWESLLNTGGEAAVAAEIKRGLEYMFNTTNLAGAPVTIPAPLRTHVQIWPAAWHWLRAGAKSTNAQVFDWSIEPLAGEPVSLVGEAYNVNRSGWSDAAYKSSIRVLNAKYGLSLPLPRTAPAPENYRYRRFDLRRN